MNRRLLIIGSSLNAVLAVGHIACIPFLEEAFVLYGINDVMTELAACGAVLPMITVIIAGLFGLCAVWGFSGAGVIRRKMPLLKPGLAVTGCVFLLRGAWGITMLVDNFTTIELTSTLVASFIGLTYIIGLNVTDKKY